MIIDMMKSNLDEQIQIEKTVLTDKNFQFDKNYISEVNSSEIKTKKIINENLIEKIIEAIFNHFSNGLRLVGPLFSFVLLLFIATVTYSFFRVLYPYWNKKLGVNFSIIASVLFIITLFNILFNYFLAMLVKPGSINDIKRSKLYSNKNPYVFDKEMNREINISYLLEQNQMGAKSSGRDSISNSENTICNASNTLLKIGNSNTQSPFRMCKICDEIKPLRAHHCQICGFCVFKMDHHCPWINNCVGQNNHRYFILFLTHTFIGCIFINILSCPLFFSEIMQTLPTEFNFVCILCLTGSVLLLFFNCWNWFLVINGNTTIEFWTKKSGIQNQVLISDFNLNTIEENFFLVFGTKSLFKAVFIPSIQMLPYSGLEWSRLSDPNFLIKTIQMNEKVDNQEVESIERDLLSDIEI